MPPLNIFAYTNVAELLAAWLAQAPAGGVNARARWLGKQIGCSRTQIWNLLDGGWDVQPGQVAALGRALGQEGEALEYLRVLAAFPNAPSETRKALHASLWATHAARMGLPATAVPALMESRPIPMSAESALLALLPVLQGASAQEVEALLWSPPEPGVADAALALAEQGLSVGALLSPRMVVVSADANTDARTQAAMHGLLEIARDGLLAVPAEDRDYHTVFWSADAEAATALTLAREALGRDLRALVREHAEEPVARVFLLWTEQLCLGPIPSAEPADPPGERGPEPLSVQVGARYAPKAAPNLTMAGPPCIYLYLDFPTYFRAWYAWRKATRKPRSAAWIGKRLKVSRSMANYLMKGAPKLRPDHLPGLVRVFGFTDEELAYVEGMIRLDTATDLAERVWMRRALISYAVARGTRTWEGEAYRVAAHWAPRAIRALAHLPSFQDDPAWISAALRGYLCEADVDDLLQALIEAGMLVSQAGGPLRPAVPESMVPPELHDLARFGFHDSFLRLAQTELRRPGASSPPTAWIVALPESAMQPFRARLDAYKDEILGHLQASDARPGPQDRVLLFGMQLRPLTHTLVPSLVPRTRRRR